MCTEAHKHITDIYNKVVPETRYAYPKNSGHGNFMLVT